MEATVLMNQIVFFLEFENMTVLNNEKFFENGHNSTTITIIIFLIYQYQFYSPSPTSNYGISDHHNDTRQL